MEHKITAQEIKGNDQRGQSLVLVALMMVGLLGFVGLAVDVGFVFARRAQLTAAVDAAALAGATEVVGPGGIGAANERALQYLHSNGVPPAVTYASFESQAFPPDLIGVQTYAITVTWPVELYFMRVLGRDHVNLLRSATAAYFPLADIYASRRVEDGALTTSNQSVFGPHICTGFGDPVSPAPDHNPDWGIQQGVYHYRILIPPDYPSNILRVELFDPDSINQAQNDHAVAHTDIAINAGMPPIEQLICDSDNRRSACLIDTGEADLPDVLPEQINLWWFVRIDENRGAGPPPGNGQCGYPDEYTVTYNTRTLYSLFYYARRPDGTIERIPLAQYTGQTDDPAQDYDKVNNTAYANHRTDMQWTGPGGRSIYDQLAAVPTDCGSNNGGYSVVGTGDGGNPAREAPGGRCYIPGAPQENQPLYSPPGSGRGFEIDLDYYNNILADETTGNRYLYLDVQSIWGASENGFEIWAGPPDYTENVSANVNVRNVQIVNTPGSHSSKGATVFGLGRLPMNSNYSNRVSIPLIYIGPEYAGEQIYISMFDPDAGAKPPIDFYFDSIPFDDYHITYGAGQDPDGRCFDGGDSYEYGCDNEWVTPDFIMPIPDLTDDPICQIDPGNNLEICTPFYGGRLMARYKGGQNDTYSWRIIVTGLPYLIR